MARLPFTVLPWQIRQVLSFLNNAPNADTIADDEVVKDDPSAGGKSNIAIGPTVAQRIIEARNQLPSQQFTTLDQVLDVEGVGPDKIRDLLFSVTVPRAERFRRFLFDSELLLDNWRVDNYRFTYDEAAFEQLICFESAFRKEVSDRILEIVLRTAENPLASRLAGQLIRETYLDIFESPGIAQYAFALWWYRFDQDNWFSFERIRETLSELLFDKGSFNERTELRFFRGFDNGATLSAGITPTDLPVTIHFDERAIVIWSASLFD